MLKQMCTNIFSLDKNDTIRLYIANVSYSAKMGLKIFFVHELLSFSGDVTS